MNKNRRQSYAWKTAKDAESVEAGNQTATLNPKGNNDTLTLPEIVNKKPWKKVSVMRRAIARRSASSSATEQNPLANDNELSRKDGRIVTVEDFLADVELIKNKQKPKIIQIGLERTELQKLDDETEELKKQKLA